jgi:hypothetical protein
MNFRAWSGVSTVGGEYGFFFIVLGPLVFSAPKRYCAAHPSLQICAGDFVTKSESHWLTMGLFVNRVRDGCLPKRNEKSSPVRTTGFY